ncbi:MAG: alpha/beta hydrolase [Nitrospinota bacterium]|nr:alpha/beta hydrolase [Nitrospinota bacterium]
MKKIFALALSVLSAQGAAGCAYISESMERPALFYPRREYVATPAMAGLKAEEVFILSGEFKIHCWFFQGRPDALNIVYFHGNAENISYLLGLVQMFEPSGINFLLVDYRGYGHSQGAPSVDGIVEDAVAAVDWMMARRNAPSGRVALWGRSMGAAAALGATQQRPGLAGIIVESGFISLKKIAAHHMPRLPSFLVRDKLNNLAIISSLPIPKLIIHGERDKVIPFDHGVELYEKAMAPKEFFPVAEAGHNDVTKKADDYHRRISAWLSTL